MKKVLVVIAAISFGLVAPFVVPALPASAAGSSIYNSIPSVLPGNLASVGFEATQASEFGDQVAFSNGSGRILDNVAVTMSSWGCQSGSWNGDDCSTTAGTTFSEPITLNIYNVGPSNSVGSLIATRTQTFNIPFRPSADNTHCVGAEAGEWYQASTASCFNGYAVNETFDFTNQFVTLPNKVIYGVAYNTSDYGAMPYGDSTTCHSTTAGCGYDSLNIGLTEDPAAVTVGSDPVQGQVYWNTSTPSNYCDGGAAGSGTFRLDSPATASCWGVNSPYNSAPYYVPAVQFNAHAVVPVTISYISPMRITHGGTAHFFVKLATTTNSPIANRRMTVTLGNGSHQQSCQTGKTNSQGLASCTIGAVQAKRGTRTVKVTFAGDVPGPNYFYQSGMTTQHVTIH